MRSGSYLRFSTKLLIFITFICGAFLNNHALANQSHGNQELDRLEKGKLLAFDKTKGNCLACHMIPGGNQPGNIAPPLIQMKARFPDKGDLKTRIWDATKLNPDTVMPPYGKNKILTEKEIELIVDFLLSN